MTDNLESTKTRRGVHASPDYEGPETDAEKIRADGVNESTPNVRVANEYAGLVPDSVKIRADRLSQ